jgi:hypothetical protein
MKKDYLRKLVKCFRTGRDETKRKTQERMERRNRKSSSSAGSDNIERVGDRQGKNGEVLFDRLKPTAGCSPNGRRRSKMFPI